MSEVEKDVCLECGVEIVDGGSWGYCVPCGNEVFDKLIQDKLKKPDEFLKRHEREHAKARGNVARDYVTNTEAATLQEILQSEREMRQQETEEFMYKELLRCMQARQKVTHELDEFFNQETDNETHIN